MEDSWGYIWEKAHDLMRDAFLIDGSLASRLKQVEADRLMYLFGRTPPDPELKKRFDDMAERWRKIRVDIDELEISDFGGDLLSMIWEIDQRYLEEKFKSG